MPIPTGTPILVVDLIYGVSAQINKWKMTIYLEPTTPPTTAANMVTFCNSVLALHGGALGNCLSNNCVVEYVYARFYSGSQFLEGFSTSAPITGAQVGDVFPEEVCAIIRRRTGLAGRQNRGRVFISGIVALNANDGILDPAFPTAPALRGLASILGSDQTLTPCGTCHARHYDRKDNQMVVVTNAYAMQILLSRGDRLREERRNNVPA